MAEYFKSPFGEAVGFLYLNKPDDKYKQGGEFKTKLRLSGAPAQALREKVQAAAEAALAEHLEKLREKGGDPAKPVELKKWKLYVPFTIDEDDEGNPTGDITFDFKQNATITIKKTGEVKKVQMGLYDAAGKPMKALIRAGAILRTTYSMRPTVIVSTKQVGVRMDFASVQVKSMPERSAPGGGYEAVEGGGYVEDEVADDADTANPAETSSAGTADY